MNNMESDEERLSAYLDGELSGDALEQIERQLQHDTEFRRCLDDYRLLRASMQGLPNYSPNSDFSARVLQRIQARTSSVPTAAADTSPAVQIPARPTQERTRVDPTPQRTWLRWGIGVLAASALAALAIPVFQNSTNSVALNHPTSSAKSDIVTIANSQSTPQATMELKSGVDARVDASKAGSPKTPTDRDNNFQFALDDVKEEASIASERDGGQPADSVDSETDGSLALPAAPAPAQEAQEVLGRSQTVQTQPLLAESATPPTDANKPSAASADRLAAPMPAMQMGKNESDSGSQEPVTFQYVVVAGKNTSMETADYLVQSPGVDEQRLLGVLDSMQQRVRVVRDTRYRLEKVRSDDSSQQRFKKDAPPESEQRRMPLTNARQEIAQRIGQQQPGLKSADPIPATNAKAAGNVVTVEARAATIVDAAARYVVVDASIDDFIEVLRELDPLAGETIALIPWGQHAHKQVGERESLADSPSPLGPRRDAASSDETPTDETATDAAASSGTEMVRVVFVCPSSK